jgi:hypothetical protein
MTDEPTINSPVIVAALCHLMAKSKQRLFHAYAARGSDCSTVSFRAGIGSPNIRQWIDGAHAAINPKMQMRSGGSRITCIANGANDVPAAYPSANRH